MPGIESNEGSCRACKCTRCSCGMCSRVLMLDLQVTGYCLIWLLGQLCGTCSIHRSGRGGATWKANSPGLQVTAQICTSLDLCPSSGLEVVSLHPHRRHFDDALLAARLQLPKSYGRWRFISVAHKSHTAFLSKLLRSRDGLDCKFGLDRGLLALTLYVFGASSVVRSVHSPLCGCDGIAEKLES